MNLKEAENILKFYENELKEAPCSKGHHLNIRGGLMIHLKNTEQAAREIDLTQTRRNNYGNKRM